MPRVTNTISTLAGASDEKDCGSVDRRNPDSDSSLPGIRCCQNLPKVDSVYSAESDSTEHEAVSSQSPSSLSVSAVSSEEGSSFFVRTTFEA